MPYPCMQLGLKSSFFINRRAPDSLKQNTDLSPAGMGAWGMDVWGYANMKSGAYA